MALPDVGVAEGGEEREVLLHVLDLVDEEVDELVPVGGVLVLPGLKGYLILSSVLAWSRRCTSVSMDLTFSSVNWEYIHC